MATNRATRYPGRWGAVSADYRMGEPKNRTSDTAKDGSYFEKDWIADYEAYFGALLDEAGETVDGTTDTAQSSQLHKAMQKAREVSPLNNDWNGYLDPDHQSSLPSGAGYPGNSGGGEVAYAADEEISYGIYAGASGATVSSDDDGWIVSAGSIYKLFTLTAEQLALIDVTTVPIFLKDQAGAAYFVNHNGTTINVTKPDTTTLKVEITSGIFAGLSITKLWRFFVTEKVGYVGELGSYEVINLYHLLKKRIKCVMDGTTGAIYSSEGILSVTRVAAGTYDIVTEFLLPSLNYNVTGSGSPSGVATVERIGIVGLLSLPARTTNSFRIITAQNGDNGAGAATRDYEVVSFEVAY